MRASPNHDRSPIRAQLQHPRPPWRLHAYDRGARCCQNPEDSQERQAAHDHRSGSRSLCANALAALAETGEMSATPATSDLSISAELTVETVAGTVNGLGVAL